MTLDDLETKTCLIGLSYFDTNNALLRQVQHAGTVVKIDQEKGISVALKDSNPNDTIASDNGDRIFVLPPLLSAWFRAPAGLYRDQDGSVLIENPDYFVTWDIHKTQDEKQGDHEWWEWVPRTVAPKVN